MSQAINYSPVPIQRASISVSNSSEQVSSGLPPRAVSSNKCRDFSNNSHLVQLKTEKGYSQTLIGTVHGEGSMSLSHF